VLRNSISAYLLYVPAAGLGLLVAGLLEGGSDVLGDRPAGGAARRRAVVPALGALGALGLALATYASPWLNGYGEWADAGRVSSLFIAEALPCFAGAPAGSTVRVQNLPHHLEYGTPESQFLDVYIFEPYSLPALLKVLAPGTQVAIDVQSVEELSEPPAGVDVRCGADGQDRVVATRVVS
jgi:hypothetical protein